MTPPPAWNSSIFPAYFDPTPWEMSQLPFWTSPVGSIRLALFGVDSNSGLSDFSSNRRARGEISDREFAVLADHLKKSAQQPDKPGVTTIRAIVCHHAFTPKPGWIRPYPLSDQSARVLTALAATYRVAVIFTGHNHAANFRRIEFQTTPFGEKEKRNCIVYEIRCPTTLQGPADALKNGFWVHTLARSHPEAEVTWTPVLYLLAGQRLTPQPVDTLETLVLPPQLSASLPPALP